MAKNLGMTVLGVYLVVVGLVPLLELSFVNLGTVVAVLAVAAEVLILTGR